MKLMDTTFLQETEKQASVAFSKRVKEMAHAMGWKKGDQLAIYRQGAGFLIVKAGGSLQEEIKLLKKEKITEVDLDGQG